MLDHFMWGLGLLKKWSVSTLSPADYTAKFDRPPVQGTHSLIPSLMHNPLWQWGFFWMNQVFGNLNSQRQNFELINNRVLYFYYLFNFINIFLTLIESLRIFKLKCWGISECIALQKMLPYLSFWIKCGVLCISNLIVTDCIITSCLMCLCYYDLLTLLRFT